MTDRIALALLGAGVVLLVLLALAWWFSARAAARREAEWAAQFGSLLPQLQQGLPQWVAPVVREDGERRSERLQRELGDAARFTREDISAALARTQAALLAQGSDTFRTQNEQIDQFRLQLATLQTEVARDLRLTTDGVRALGDAARAAQAQEAERLRQEFQRLEGEMRKELKLTSDGLTQRQDSAREAQDAGLRRLQAGLAEQMQELAATTERRLVAMQQGNEARLEQMRQTVDEKLHATLEQRLGESFRQVAERLEVVHQGLGEMQSLARDVGSLNRVLTNVKTRGVFGEVQLAGLLEQVFAPDQYAANVETVPGSGQRVEFAVKMPGRLVGGTAGEHVWLPIDAKFPREDFERLLEAHERADAVGVDEAATALERRLRVEARTIRSKYVAHPHTIDFAILFLPSESLYAEALRRPGLVEALQREHRVTLAGPTTLLATLSSLQMGFRTLALERRSQEVWEVLGAVKTEFNKFGGVIEKMRKKLEEATGTLDAAAVRTRAMQRRLRQVEALPEAAAEQALKGPLPLVLFDGPADQDADGRDDEQGEGG